MQFDSTTIVGIVASVCIAANLLPQLIKLLKEKQAEGLSIGMLVILLIGQALWIAYGVLKNDWIIIASNAFSIIVNGCIMILALKSKRGI